MKVKKWTFFMTNQLILDLGSSKKLNLSQCDNYSSSYVAKKMGTYPQIIWKMAIFWKSYTRQWQTASLLTKVAPFLIKILTLLTVFAPFCSLSYYSDLNYGKTSEKRSKNLWSSAHCKIKPPVIQNLTCFWLL